MIKRADNWFILIFYFNFFAAQVDPNFINHLSANNLSNEHRHYLNSFSQSSDSLEYYKAKFDLKYFNDSLFLDHYHKSKIICDHDSLMLLDASTSFLIRSSDVNTRNWFDQLPQLPANEGLKKLQMVYKGSVNPNFYTEEIFPEPLRASFSNYKKAYNKKPLLAAALSTIIPGLGKLYAGKTKSFFMTFIINGAYAAQTMESTKKLGLRQPLSIINAGAFAVFYFANIYGSYKAVKNLRKEHKKQFLTDAAHFYI